MDDSLNNGAGAINAPALRSAAQEFGRAQMAAAIKKVPVTVAPVAFIPRPLTPLRPALFNEDPHVGERLPNFDQTRIRQSKFFIFQPSATELPTLASLSQKLHGNARFKPEQISPSDGKGPKPRHIETNELIAMIMSHPEAVDFILDHVIPKGHGALDAELRAEIREVLADPSLWVESDQRVVGEMEVTPGNDFHKDGGPSGELRFLYSADKATQLRPGWHDHGDSVKSHDLRSPVLAPGQEGIEPIVPDTGSIVLFETTSGIHSIPEVNAEELASFGGQRTVLSTSFTFDKVIDRAYDQILSRPFTPPAPKPPQVGGVGR